MKDNQVENTFLINSFAVAHHQSDQVVINLTKMAGAGSLAHECFHALDNSFMKKDDKETLVWDE